jgi:hypothetical protein
MEVENLKIAEKLRDLLIQSQNNSLVADIGAFKQSKK